MSLYNEIINGKEKISVIGLGYVGMPIAVAFAKKVDVIGFDLNKKKIELYKAGIDPTNEVGNNEIKKTSVEFTSDETKLKNAKFHIVAVPTPINSDKTPDLSPVEGASRIVGRNLIKGSIVVYESTVYPGVTEDICVPILEEESGLKCGIDFKVGYSPERINPGDKVHRLENIIKIVSGIDEESLEEIAKIYELVIEVGVHRAGSVKVAEAAKVVENSQRDINIAFMNELAMVFDRMGIDTKEVIDAMNTKWNALGFTPGLVGGHCIGVDPYYFVYEAEKLGYHSQIILSGRKINDGMGKFVADAIIKKLILANKVVRQARVVILGITFKENTPDTRNSKVVDIIDNLIEYGIEPIVVDPEADAEEAKHEYGIDLVDIKDINYADCLVLAVAHDIFKQMTWNDLDSLYGDFDNKDKVFIDVKSMLDRREIEDKGYSYWRL
ncbi:nucleotide sugar dehydrogenase [Clostridium formicaceticum]|uniref:UDP-N-acetyl-D-galactosamine dehydrogenase n=1 Tax=Clostridium formicaceticum TaxID=1497 RepID=A0AAC9RFQ2_9CLOT|nr:nucleotide sugar dehydrogenase [Clostridium formicaceticum]AOY75602.1 UDP-N-acetyl-D-galactosamine dehydrogenase [Clostridium formicaceticum]ARE85911.1 UDP-N-acetyl-D-glucosamine 6-dehydrogenase [Clostridium formicaceticum]